MNDSPSLAAILLIVGVSLGIYLLPTIVAWRRGHLSVMAIGFANVIFGWTLLFWLLCMIWALNGSTRANRRLNLDG